MTVGGMLLEKERVTKFRRDLEDVQLYILPTRKMALFPCKVENQGGLSAHLHISRYPQAGPDKSHRVYRIRFQGRQLTRKAWI